jgi:hypothetical protein
MSSLISQRMRRRRIQCSRAVCSRTQRRVPRPEPWSVPCRAMAGVMPFGPQLMAVGVVVVAAVGVELLRWLSGSSADASDRWDLVDQGQQLGDVVAVAAGQAGGEGDAARVGDDVVFRARAAAVDRARAGFGPPLSARMWEPSITARDMSS